MKKTSEIILKLEEGLIALLLASMTILTFTQVAARYIFNSGWGGALETTTILFQWLVLIGLSLGIKKKTHLGVDFVLKFFSKVNKRRIAFIVVFLCLIYVGLMLYGSVIYFGKMYEIGIHAQDIPVPRWVIVAVLPLGLILLGFRLLQAGIQVYQGKIDQLTASEADLALNHAKIGE